jgi:hypothetical protein
MIQYNNRVLNLGHFVVGTPLGIFGGRKGLHDGLWHISSPQPAGGLENFFHKASGPRRFVLTRESVQRRETPIQVVGEKGGAEGRLRPLRAS